MEISELIDREKYRLPGETFEDKCERIAKTLSDNEDHYEQFSKILKNKRFLPAGRIQRDIGTPHKTTAINCFVAPNVPDDIAGIMDIARYAALTLKMGGGIGFNFSEIRPRGEVIKSLGSYASGPVSFMHIFDAVSKTISSAGNRRGAMMSILRVDHPDIFEFITAKRDEISLTGFNMSVAITDEFMDALERDDYFELKFNGKVYSSHKASEIWDLIMENTYDWAEPGIVFIDRINQMNNLYYSETLYATNPCGEQPLPENGSCLLGSFNLTQYIDYEARTFLFTDLENDIRDVVRAMDNVIENTSYPLPEQEREQKSKRRMGLGYTGLANAIEYLGFSYGSKGFLDLHEEIAKTILYGCYSTSVELAKEKGSFPLFDKEKYLRSKFIQTLPYFIQKDIEEYGIRNSHLTSIAPTGTISLASNNISPGVEPPFSWEYEREVKTEAGTQILQIVDYMVNYHGQYGKRSQDVTIDEHIAVQSVAQRYSDSAVSKTVNLPSTITFENFKNVYLEAYHKGMKGITTFRVGGERDGIMNETCYVDEKGQKHCD